MYTSAYEASRPTSELDPYKFSFFSSASTSSYDDKIFPGWFLVKWSGSISKFCSEVSASN